MIAAVLPSRFGWTNSLTCGYSSDVAFDDGDRVIGAAAGDDDDLGDFDTPQLLSQQRVEQAADVRLFIVSGHADAAAQLRGID